MDKTRWVKVQEALQRAGFYLLKPNGQPYTVDGVPGDGTDTELKKWEQSLGLSQVGVIRSSVPTMDATSRDILLKDQGLAYGTVVRLGQP